MAFLVSHSDGTMEEWTVHELELYQNLPLFCCVDVHTVLYNHTCELSVRLSGWRG